MIKKQLTYHITEQDENLTVEQFLKRKGYSHRLVVHLRNTTDGLTIGGELAYTIHRLKAGEVLRVLLVEEEDSHNIVPTQMPLSIVYEDEDILVVNKDAGVPIHPSQGHFDNTLANAVAWYYRQKEEPFVYRAINRLDRDTTGLLILAKHMLSACILSDQMVKRQIKREYLALVCGLVPESGTIDKPIGRAEGSTVERCVDYGHGESAVTHFRRLSYEPEKDLSLISLRLETGRTHQIRVHMASIGHPLPGDFLYHPDYRYISRQPLHSHRLDFVHPLTGLPLSFEAALPDDMAKLLSPGTLTANRKL
jgi:23S rRNA pseudouridine1911/1915/1917 synthase